MAEKTVSEAVYSLRAVREYKPDPVSKDDLAKIVRAGTFACSSGNTQPWEFVVLTDPKLRKQVQEWMAEAFAHVNAQRAQPKEALVDGVGRPITGDAAVRNIGTVPAIILVLWNPERGIRMKNEYKTNPDGTMEENRHSQGRGSSLFPCCQNMMLTANSLGIGSLFTTFLKLRAPDIKKLLHIPPQMFLEAGIFIGHPNEKLGMPRRRAIELCTHDNVWEKTFKSPELVGKR